MADRIRIVIADDHPVVRGGLRAAIERDASLVIIAEAADGRAALGIIEEQRPDIAIVDLSMPHLDGLQLAEEVRRRNLPVKLIILTVHADPELFERATDSGARGYLLKDSAMLEIESAIRDVAAGRFYASPSMAGYLMERRQRARRFQSETAGVTALTAAEKQILILIADYKTSSQIASELHVSPRTVGTHRANICQKLGLHGSHALMKFAVDHRAELV